MSVLSIDIGTRNLAVFKGRYNQANYDKYGMGIDIEIWKLIDLHVTRSQYNLACERALKEFFSTPDFYKDTVLVILESQSQSVEIMKYLFYTLFGHFKTLANSNPKLKLIVSTGGCKLKVYDGPNIEVKSKTEYQHRKRLAIQHTKALISRRPDFTFWKNWFSKLKKKDDVSDAFLQAGYYIYKQNNPKHFSKIHVSPVKVNGDSDYSFSDEESLREPKPKPCLIPENSDDEMSTSVKSVLFH